MHTLERAKVTFLVHGSIGQLESVDNVDDGLLLVIDTLITTLLSRGVGTNV